jgi:N-acetylmuramoyl-L-alanine amidase
MYYGYSVGVDGADGDYGSNTERGVTQFQRDRKLTADGICGEETWKKLLNVQEEKDSD